MTLPVANRTFRPLPDSFRKLALLFGATTAVLGLFGLLGWILGMPLLASVRSSYIPMAPLTAIASLCLGGVLLVHSMSPLQGSVNILAAVLSGLLSAYGLIEIVEGLGIHVLSLEEYIFPNPPMMDAIPIGRMSPTTAVLLLLSGAVVPMLVLRKQGGERQKLFGDLAGCLGILVAGVGTVFVLSYLHGAPFLYGTSTIPMAATTAFAFLLLGTGQILAAGLDSFPARLFAGPSTRARLLRVFGSTTIGIVVLIDLLHVYAHRIFFADNAFLSGVSTMVFAVITGALIARVAFKVGDDMDHSEEVRKEAEYKLRESEDCFRDLVEHSQDLVCTHDLEGRILSANPWAVSVLGYAQDELRQMNMRDLLVPEVRPEFGRYLDEIRTQGIARGLMWVQARNGERRLWEYKNTLRTEGVAEPIVRGMAQDITERKQAEEALRESEGKFRVIFEGSIDGIILADVESRKFLTANKTFCDMLQYTLDEITQLGVADIHPVESLSRVLEAFERGVKQKSVLEGEIPLQRKDGSVLWTEVTASPVMISGNKYLMGSFRDVTERKRAEKEKEKLQSQLRQAQKMEAVGRLAGGVAHDFNNLLTVITGYSELLLQKIGKESPTHKEVEEIRRAGERAASLTQQLLAFSRKQIIEPKVLDLNLLMANLGKMLIRLIGEDIQLKMVPCKDLGRVMVDPSQFDQVLINLAVNARDAMPDGGTLLIETANVDLDEEYCAQRPYEIHPGRFVMLTVSDTGHGMTKEVTQQIFEPFFTTKATGKGTGLGLSMVYGAVKQSGGSIEVYSEVGKGTTFKIYLPRVAEGAVKLVEDDRMAVLRTGTETVLVVEDDETLRKLGILILGGLGYKVLQAGNGDEAISLAVEYKERIDLLLTDVVMPGMNGAELARQLVLHRPEMKVLFTSGHTDEAITRHGVLDKGVSFIGKPYTPSALAKKVREVLDKA